jgi:methylase of polypeptide subunit release factors
MSENRMNFIEMLLMQQLSPEENEIIDNILKQVQQKNIPDSYPEKMINNLNRLVSRDKLIKEMGFVLVSNDWIKPLSDWIGKRNCLEIMSGTGALSYALQKQGINIIATDDYSWKVDESNNQDFYWREKLWTEVENLDAIEAVKKYGQETNIIIMSWPYMDNTAYKVLQTMREVNPFCMMIFIGEGPGGCTADNDFFDSIKEIEDKGFINAISNYKQWLGIYDYPKLVK